MATEWYLMSPTGYDSDALSDYEAEAFLELLDSAAAMDVELYNYDLSECQEIRAIIQKRTEDTMNNTMKRQALVPIGTFTAGMYIKYDGRYWLIVGLVDNNTVYEKGVMVLCTYLLSWVNDDGGIVQRWVNIESASQYNNGETSTTNYTLQSDQVFVLAPNDDETIKLSDDDRFIIDRRCKVYEENLGTDIESDTSKMVYVYRFTRADNVFYDYQDSGIAQFITTQTEQDEDDGYYVVDGQGYWLCKPPTIVGDTDVSSVSVIECEEAVVYSGVEAGIFTAKFYDADGEEVDVEPVWSIDCDFINSLTVEYVDNSMLISVSNKKLINKTFTLTLAGDGYDSTSITITIKAFL